MNKNKRSVFLFLFLFLFFLNGCDSHSVRSETAAPDTETPEAILLTQEDYSGLHISEIMPKNTAVLMIDGAFPDWIELENQSEKTINLEGCILSDGTHLSPLPSIILQP